jgi:cysteine synthase
MREPVWVPLQAAVAIQRELIAEHGGLTGPPRGGELEAALDHPRNLHAYAETRPTLPQLAAGDLTEEALADWIEANATAVR